MLRPSPILPLLAEANESTIILWLLVLIILVLAGFYGVVMVRRWAHQDDTGPEAGGGFTLSQLRELHRRGKITAEEFEKARSQMLAAGKSMTEGIDPLARPGGSCQEPIPATRQTPKDLRQDRSPQ